MVPKRTNITTCPQPKTCAKVNLTKKHSSENIPEKQIPKPPSGLISKTLLKVFVIINILVKIILAFNYVIL